MKRLATSTLSAMLLTAAGLASAPPASAQQYETLCISFNDEGALQEVTLGNTGYTCPNVEPTETPLSPNLLVLNEDIKFVAPSGSLSSAQILLTLGSAFDADATTARGGGGGIKFTTTDDLTVTAQGCDVQVTQKSNSADWECTGDLLGDPVVIVAAAPEPDPGNGGNSSTSDGGTGEYIQQFAKSPSMTCDEAQPEGLNWSGVPSGGWSESWAQWPNEGNGGEVCVRTVFYNNSTSKWDIR